MTVAGAHSTSSIVTINSGCSSLLNASEISLFNRTAFQEALDIILDEEFNDQQNVMMNTFLPAYNNTFELVRNNSNLAASLMTTYAVINTKEEKFNLLNESMTDRLKLCQQDSRYKNLLLLILIGAFALIIIMLAGDKMGLTQRFKEKLQ